MKAVASEPSRVVYQALADWFHQQAELLGEPLIAETDNSGDAVSDGQQNQEDEGEDESKARRATRETEQGQPGVSVTVTAAALRASLSKGYFRRCLSVAEKIVVVVGCQAVLLRVQLVNDKTMDEQALETVYHCHRGLLTDETAIYVVRTRRFYPSSLLDHL